MNSPETLYSLFCTGVQLAAAVQLSSEGLQSLGLSGESLLAVTFIHVVVGTSTVMLAVNGLRADSSQ